jgi:NAD(P)-dependent dehydrogenase (short-subunit alcohol dehydrogenase family)
MTAIALVTGGNRGIGLATARALAKAGMVTVLGARNAEAGEGAAAQLRSEGLKVESVQLDVASEASMRQAADSVRSRHDRLDVLVNNAGVLPEATHAAPREVLDLAMFRRTFETNLFGAVGVIEALKAATLPDNTESGAFFDRSGTVAW